MLINSYAKINLYLEVLSKRPDGYHEIETLFSTINLYDSLKFALTKKPLIKILSNIPELASEDNLIHQVATKIITDFDVRMGVEIHLQKRIPVSAGLGGGSSNAAMTILALDELCGLNLDENSKNALAAGFGSDVNFFLYGGIARGTSRGEKLETLPETEPLELLLVNPGIAVSSQEAYQLVNPAVSSGRNRKEWFNSLEAGIRTKYPLINEVIVSLRDMGASEAMMSGSGATCFGLFPDRTQQDNAAAHFKDMKYWVKAVKTLGRSQYRKCTQNLSL